jgi:hypothetical protein
VGLFLGILIFMKRLLLGLTLLLLVACPSPPTLQGDATAQLEILNSPFLHPDPFSRNVWDLQVVQDRVLIASGDAWKNSGTNIQKIAVVSYSSNHFFTKEFTVNDEQIHRFVVSGEKVFIPGFDPLEDWSLGNFYTLETRCLAPVPCWSKTRTIPFGVHSYDVIEFDSKLFVTIGGYDAETKPGLLESSDAGRTWQSVTAPELLGLTFTRFFVFENELFAVQEVQADSSTTALAKYSNGVFSSAGLFDKNLVPDLPETWVGRLGRISVFKNRVLYTAGSQGNNLALPEAVYSAASLSSAERIVLRINERPTDLLVLETEVVLLTTEAQAGGYINRVYTSGDGQNFKEQFLFTSSRFARSLERLGAAWIFGLGCLESENCDGAGVLLRLTAR